MASVRKIKRRIVKNFRDIAILAILKENEGLNAHEVMEHIYKKIGVLLPAGTIYSTIYALEREGLVKAVQHIKCRIYMLTSKGDAELEQVDEIIATFNLFMAQLLGKKVTPILTQRKCS